MSIYNSENDLSNFKGTLIKYFQLKNNSQVVSILTYSKIAFQLHSHDNWNGGHDIYVLFIELPLELYVENESNLNEIAESLKLCINKLAHSNDLTGDVIITAGNEGLERNLNDTLITTVEKLKLILISKATGVEASNNEYRDLRKALINRNELTPLIPSFVKACSNLSEFWAHIKTKYSTYASRREYISHSFIELLDYVESSSLNSPLSISATNTFAKLNTSSVNLLWRKALNRLRDDPEGAITAANTLLENTIKCILNNLEIDYSDENDNIPKLYGLLAKKLQLSPSQHIEQIFKQILGGCNSIVLGLGGLRNKIGDAHVSGKKPIKPAVRHAELAVNLGGTMATFLIATWEKYTSTD